MNQDNLASAIILTTMLAFVVQALARRRLAPARGFWMAAVWVVIIVVLVALFAQFPPRGG